MQKGDPGDLEEVILPDVISTVHNGIYLHLLIHFRERLIDPF
jgi:hypothetical protein